MPRAPLGALTRWLYFRLLGLTALVATASLWTQLPGLIGSRGIWPAAEQLGQAAKGGAGFWHLPTLAWLWPADPMLHGLCAAAVALSLLLVFNVAPRAVLPMLYASWLSLVAVGAPFLQFQWDILLAEALFWSVVYAPSGMKPGYAFEQPAPGWARLVVFTLGFKVAFCSGVVKLGSRDPSWRDLTALSYHHWTQPLPNPVSYLLAQWDLGWQQLLCALVFLFELLLPLLAYGPRPTRLVAGVSLVSLQLWLIATGNFAYFNVLCLALAVPLFDDAALRGAAHKAWRLPPEPAEPPRAQSPRWRKAGLGLAALVLLGGAFSFTSRHGLAPAPRPLSWLLEAAGPFHLFGAYGAFAVMTRTRPEIIVEGSDDGVAWKPYEFPFKPGRLDRMPPQVAPWQPRLDWQLWFAALGGCQESAWFLSLQRHLLLGTPEVLALFSLNPFPSAPPKRVRSIVYQYRFAPLSAKGQWWTRELDQPFCPELAVDAAGNLRLAEE